MNQHWHKIRRIHFDRENGAPFWIERARKQNIDVFAEVNTGDDFWKLGPLELEELRKTPPWDFVPKSMRDKSLIPIESGGSSGDPVLTFFDHDEFDQAFVAPFMEVYEKGLFPSDGAWLYLGPTGPHAIGRAARICAQKCSSLEPFTIDFDPRWVKKFSAESMPAQRYIEHLCDQTLLLWNRVPIRTLFVTPPLLDQLCVKVQEHKRDEVMAIQLGGMGASAEQWQKWRECFRNAKFLIGYGNSLVGVMYYDEEHNGYVKPQNPRMLITLKKQAEDVGQIIVHRLDSTVMYLNLCERDQACYVNINGRDVLHDVAPLVTLTNVKKGLY